MNVKAGCCAVMHLCCFMCCRGNREVASQPQQIDLNQKSLSIVLVNPESLNNALCCLHLRVLLYNERSIET